MILPLLIKDWVMARLLKLGVVAIGVSVAMGACLLRDASIERKGGEKRQAQIEKATDNASKAGKRAADRAADPGVRGRRDPSTRDD